VPANAEHVAIVTSDTVASAATLAQMALSVPVAAEVLGTTKNDTTLRVAYAATVAGDGHVPAEFMHLTFGLEADANITIEFGQFVIVDTVVSADSAKTNLSTGVQLQPDQWEKDHEP
jgi:hypothetical protein